MRAMAVETRDSERDVSTRAFERGRWTVEGMTASVVAARAAAGARATTANAAEGAARAVWARRRGDATWVRASESSSSSGSSAASANDASANGAGTGTANGSVDAGVNGGAGVDGSAVSTSYGHAWLFEEEHKKADGDHEGGAGGARVIREGASRAERHHGHYLSKPYAVYRIDAKGQRMPYKQIMTRRQLLSDTDLTPRDLRRIDPTLGQITNTPALLVREDSVLVNMGVRMIIRADHALLLEPDTMMSVNFLESWSQRMMRNTPSEAETMQALPFELTMVEAALQETCAQLENRLEYCARKYRSLDRKLHMGIEKTTFDEMRFMKQALVQLETRVSAIRDEILDTLDDEDDVERMTLSSQATGTAKEEELEEVQNLLEYYLQQTEAVHGATEALLENTRDLDESISVTLSARRLEVSKIELILSIVSFAAAIGAVVTGIFGMNLTSTFESSIFAFYLCTSLLITACAGLSLWLYRLCKKRGIL